MRIQKFKIKRIKNVRLKKKKNNNTKTIFKLKFKINNKIYFKKKNNQ